MDDDLHIGVGLAVATEELFEHAGVLFYISGDSVEALPGRSHHVGW